jgi:hypothetical protein
MIQMIDTMGMNHRNRPSNNDFRARNILKSHIHLHPPPSLSPGWSSGWDSALNAIKVGSPLLIIDTRLREEFTSRNRSDLISEAKRQWQQRDSTLAEVNTFDFFDVDTIAFFHEALFGEGR